MSSPRTSIEWNCAEFIRLKLLTSSAFVGQDIRHWDKKSTVAVAEAVVLRADKGEHQLEGVQGWHVVVTVLFASLTLSDNEADKVANVIGETIYREDPTFSPTLPLVYFLSVESDSSTTRTDTRKLRKRVMTVPMIAKLVDILDVTNAAKLALTVPITTVVSISDSFVISGAGSDVNGLWLPNGLVQGKMSYARALGHTGDDDADVIYWDLDNLCWSISTFAGGSPYRSFDAVEFPWQVDTWEDWQAGILPFPTTVYPAVQQLTVSGASNEAHWTIL